ncbi:universal stress protein [Paracoccus sp. p4-l81]|uniref:universal stress protein n=1 Tax=unclassified Paracoccus (in: a-proteobacteria) TaxID=2688777 RepID=UPI0035B88035
MAWNTILTLATTPEQLDRQIGGAIALARREDAHLDLFCIGVDHAQTGYYYAGASAYVFQEAIDRALALAEETAEAARKRLTPEDIRWGVDTAVAQLGGLSALAGLKARYADLVVLAAPYGEDRGPEAEAILEAVLFEGRAPVMMLPEAGLPDRYGRRVVIAWNQSHEAMAAVHKALPVLKAADLVDIVVIDPPAQGAERSDPGGALSQFLARHGCTVQVSVLARTQPRVSDVLRRHVAETGADMIVMGAYGKSRFREAILGGATREMLAGVDVPVLMAH